MFAGKIIEIKGSIGTKFIIGQHIISQTPSTLIYLNVSYIQLCFLSAFCLKQFLTNLSVL